MDATQDANNNLAALVASVRMHTRVSAAVLVVLVLSWLWR